MNYSSQSLHTKYCELEFVDFKTDKKFYDYDGVILFQSTFETFKHVPTYSGEYLDFKYDRDELVKRQNQMSQLLEKGGFACFLIHTEFIDYTKYQDNLRRTDLCKIYLNYQDFYRKSLNGDYRITKIYRSEFESFLKDYGIGKIKFDFYSDRVATNLQKICDVSCNNLVGFMLFRKIYFIPCRLPSKDEVDDFFKKIAISLVLTVKKLRQEIPSWVDEYRFIEEEKILAEESTLQSKIEELFRRKEVYQKYKRCLCYDGELLVDSVREVLRNGLELSLNEENDEQIEDCIILDDNKNELILVEIKGTNENIKNPNIYQADSHRGRRDKPSDFPSILIMNTFIKSSNKIENKMRDINSEQIKLANDKKVLILRTVDLLNLLYLKEENKIKRNEIIDLFTFKYGHLNVSQDRYEIKIS